MLRRTFTAGALGTSLYGTRALAQSSPPIQSEPDENARLARFFNETDLERARLRPETLTLRGLKERYDELGDYTSCYPRRAMELAEAQLAGMKRQFPRGSLTPSSQVSYDLFERLVERQRLQLRWYWQSYAVSHNGSALDRIPLMLITQHRVGSPADAEAYVSRLHAVQRVGSEVADDLQQRTARGFVSPELVFRRVIPDAENQIKGAPFDSGPDHPVWADLQRKVGALQASPELKAKLLADGRSALLGPWRRGYEEYLTALRAMSAKASGDRGVWSLPDGAAYYRDILGFHTTTSLTPDEVHESGLAEVARARRDMTAIQREVGFQGGLEAFLAHVKGDAHFRYPNTPEAKQQCLADARARLAAYMTIATTQFSTLPAHGPEVRPVEAFRERTAPAVPAYQPGTPDGSRPGILYFNLTDMSQVLKPQLPAFTHHEGVPGHHFQIARQQGNAQLPSFRRFLTLTAYTEGWALYAEQLAGEAGMYRDEYEELGRVSLDAWRSARLVLDTGIHAKRWTRDEAVEYMRNNTLNSERDIQGEVDRYFADPGQATGYKIGQLKILSLREKARSALGSVYDIRAFHEAVLSPGALPLDMLEAQVDAYIAHAN